MPQDQTDKRRNLATNAVIYATEFVDALNKLIELNDERPQAGNFVDADFDGTALKHLTPGIIGTLFDFVIPNLQTNYIDVANAGRNKQILLQVRR